MLSDNIRNYRKKNNLSQEELAEKIGVSRQSVSFWENGQTQPTIDNIIALSKALNISSDILLGNTNGADVPQTEPPVNKKPSNSGKRITIIALCAAAAVILCAIVLTLVLTGGNNHENDGSDDSTIAVENTGEPATTEDNGASTPTSEPFDLFAYCKEFAIQIGQLNGDYAIYQQPSTKYGGYANEYFSIAYWADSNMVQFCLHCPLDDTYSHNFYLTMRGGYDGKYEYSSSKYFRDTGESLRYAFGYIDPATFSDSYPIGCERYDGSLDGQNDFMEQTRVGICDLIILIKQFVSVEGMDCDFSDFGFVNF